MKIAYFLVRSLFGLGLFLAGSSVFLYAQKNPAFPHIKPAQLSFWIKSHDFSSREVIIRALQNKPQYRLTIYSISLDNEVVASISPELNGIGEPSTRSDTKYEPNLLNPDRMGHGKIEFSPKDFAPKNGNGRSRRRQMVFKLRKMKIDIIVTDVELNESSTGIVRAKIFVRVKLDPSRRSRPADVRRST